MTAHQVVLTWAAPADAGTVSTYNVYRSSAACPAAGVSLTGFTKVNTAPITALTYTDTTVTAGNSYCYYGTQVQSGLESAPSNTAGGTVLPNTVTIQLVIS